MRRATGGKQLCTQLDISKLLYYHIIYLHRIIEILMYNIQYKNFLRWSFTICFMLQPWSLFPFQIEQIVDVLQWVEICRQNPRIVQIPCRLVQSLWDMPKISLEVLQICWQHPFPKYSIISLPPIKVLVGQRHTVVLNYNSLPKLLSGKIPYTWH